MSREEIFSSEYPVFASMKMSLENIKNDEISFVEESVEVESL
jgi:hypothetical protein